MDYMNKSYEKMSITLVEDGVAVLTIRNPEQMNALNMPMIRDIGEILTKVAADPDVRALVLTGEGKAFSAGGNMHAMAAASSGGADGPLTRPLWNVPNMSSEERLELKQTTGLRVMRQLYELEKPTIAAINGPAAGAGMDKAMWCDLRVMADDTFMVNSYVRVGLVPFDGAMWLLPRIVGLGRALEYMYTGRKISASECLEVGLANRVVPRADVLSVSIEWARELARGPGVATSLIKYITHQCLAMDHAEALDLSYRTRDAVFTSEDHAEGVRAFFEHREPDFRGR